ncbi:hypothetical protein GW17_00058677 [Ensete ventricosum]|nr:hypothetical protein GW17_00058677 [Ensete ventricosum]
MDRLEANIRTASLPAATGVPAEQMTLLTRNNDTYLPPLCHCKSSLSPPADSFIGSFVGEDDGERFQVLAVDMGGGGGGGRCGGELRIGLGRLVSFDAVLRL